MSSAPRPEKRRVREAFNGSAEHYDGVAVMQREVATRLLERLPLFSIQPGSILDLGSGTGFAIPSLGHHYRRAQITALDIAHNMVQHSRSRLTLLQRAQRRHLFVCGDAEQLPLASASFDLVFSNLTLQWCSDLPQLFDELLRVLKPGGLLLFTTLGPDTLKELRESWSQLDQRIHVNEFVDMHEIGDRLVESRFSHPVMEMELLTLTYRECMGLMRDLKQLGAHNVNQGRHRGLTTPAKLKAVARAYEQYRHDGVLPVSYEVVYGHAWKADPSHPPGNPDERPITLHR